MNPYQEISYYAWRENNMKELLNRKAKMLELMLEYIEKDNPLYHNTMIRIDEINRILKEIENNEKEDVETSRNKRSDY